MIRRALSAAAVSSACPAKNTIAVSMMANTIARNGAATMREFDGGRAVLLADDSTRGDASPAAVCTSARNLS